MRVFFIAWACLALVIAGFLLTIQFPYLQRVERIRENPATTTGAFTEKNCENHASREYAFEIDSKTYTGGGSSGKDCDKIQIGMPLDVHYEKSDPSNNIEDDPLATLLNEVITVGLACLFLPPISISGFWRWRTRQKVRT